MDVQSVKREHPVYKRMWAPIIGEELSVFPEQNKIRDLHAVSVPK